MVRNRVKQATEHVEGNQYDQGSDNSSGRSRTAEAAIVSEEVDFICKFRGTNVALSLFITECQG